ncbi:MAG: efflux RND transporter periplasmic adaptor subunit [wastewater metagenome]|nr:efflux RND transporter periplasmic adaptor subunit [Candidatus Loosdrechtia aerotolerans]
MKKRSVRIITLALILAIMGILTVVRLDLLKLRKKDIKAKSAEPVTMTVRAQRIEPSYLVDKIKVSGTIIPNEEVSLTSEISGKITDIYFKEGSAVKKGDVLVKINDEDLQAQLRKTIYQKKLAEQIERRMRKLIKTGIISQEEYDGALTEANSLGAEVALIKVKISKTEIKAPFDGIVGLRYVSEGAYISTDTRIAELISIKPVKIDFSIPGKYGNMIKENNTITFTVEGGNKPYRAEIYASESKIDPQTRTLRLRALYPNSRGEILPGAFAHIELTLREFENTVQIPTEALIPELGKQKVYIYKNGKVQPAYVKTGIRTEEKIQILQGLQPGDVLITSGILKIRPGVSVKLQEVN